MKVMMLGAPGVGKGTIAKMLVGKFNIPQLSTGDMLREAVAAGTEVGNEAKGYMDSGQLVPDEVVIGVIKERFEKDDCKDGFILDGFPRTILQAEALEAITKLDFVLNLEAPDATIIQRLSGRRICKGCGAIFHVTNIPPKVEGICDKCDDSLYQRDDDKEEAIKERLVVYQNQTAPLIAFYKEKGILKDIDADATQTVEQIFESCVKAVEQ